MAAREPATAIDFARSSLAWLLPEQPSHGRFALDAVLSVADAARGWQETFYLGAQVFAGNVYGEGELFKRPPYEFALASSDRHYRIFRAGHGGGTQRDDWGRVADRFKALDPELRRVACRRVGARAAELLPARELVCRMSVAAPGEGRSLELEFPVKHINVNPERDAFQVETGPVLTLAADSANAPVELLRRAYVNFNRDDRAQFLIDAGNPGDAAGNPGDAAGAGRWSATRFDACRLEFYACER